MTITYKGVWDARGYIIGRIGAALFRRPTEDDSIQPIKVGYTPRKDASICSMETMGKFSIIHDPLAKPIIPGVYEIIVAAASRSTYSIHVEMQLGYTVPQKIDTDAKRGLFGTCLVLPYFT